MIRTLPLCICLLFLLLGRGLASDQDAETPELLLRGVLNLGETQAFSLTDRSGSGGGWLKLGQSFKGYELSDYDRERQTLVLLREGETYEVSLTGSKQASGDVGSPEERMSEASRLMDLMNFEKMIDDSLQAQMNAMSDLMRQQMAQLSPDGSVDEELIEFQTKAMTEMFGGIDWQPIKEGMTEAYAEVFSKDELEAMANFYSTPAGQATIEKTPEVQTKMMQVMMPAIMEASAKMQRDLTKFMTDRANRRTEELRQISEEADRLIESAE